MHLKVLNRLRKEFLYRNSLRRLSCYPSYGILRRKAPQDDRNLVLLKIHYFQTLNAPVIDHFYRHPPVRARLKRQ